MYVRISDGQDKVIAECDVDPNHIYRDLIVLLSGLWAAHALTAPDLAQCFTALCGG